MRFRLSRRTFLKAAGTTALSSAAVRAIPSYAAPMPEGGTTAIIPPLGTLSYSDVQLLDGPMKRQFEENHARFLNLDNDRLLTLRRKIVVKLFETEKNIMFDGAPVQMVL